MASVSDFISKNLGKSLDLDGTFGAQSPDFGVAYLRHMAGDGTLTVVGNAVDWGNPDHPDLAPHGTWHPAGSDEPQAGDLCVFSGSNYGTLGVHRGGTKKNGTIAVWSQNPGPVREMDLGGKRGRDRLVGWWHLHNAG